MFELKYRKKWIIERQFQLSSIFAIIQGSKEPLDSKDLFYLVRNRHHLISSYPDHCILITVLTDWACQCHWHRSIPLRLRASQASHAGPSPQTGAFRVLCSRGNRGTKTWSSQAVWDESVMVCFLIWCIKCVWMWDVLFTGDCDTKSELLGPCLAGPPGLFIELYDNSTARPGPAWAHSPSDRQLFWTFLNSIK